MKQTFTLYEELFSFDCRIRSSFDSFFPLPTNSTVSSSDDCDLASVILIFCFNAGSVRSISRSWLVFFLRDVSRPSNSRDCGLAVGFLSMCTVSKEELEVVVVEFSLEFVSVSSQNSLLMLKFRSLFSLKTE